MKNMMQEVYSLELLSAGDTCIHRRGSAAKLLATFVFIITVISFDRYAFFRLIPYIFYPTLMMALSETPYSVLLKRFLLALPFCFFAGITNILFDRAAFAMIGGITISYGVISFFTILLRTYLCVMAVLVLVCVTPFSEMTNAMSRLKMPRIFVIIFEMTYRYMGVLFAEAYSMHIAYSLRSGERGIRIRDMGSFVGQLLLRCYDRAERVYNAMKCRGYSINCFPENKGKLTRGDFVFLAIVCFFCATLRFYDINALPVGLLGGLY